MNRMACVLVASVALGPATGILAGSDQAESVESQLALARQAYLEAWMAGDAEAVMALNTEDVALLPHKGAEPVIGAEHAREFWFPADSPPWTVHLFGQEPLRVVHEGSIAYEYGRYVLEYSFEGRDRVTDEGNYLAVWRRQSDGRWLRAAQIWNHS